MLARLEAIRSEAGEGINVNEGYRPYGFNIASYLGDCAGAKDMRECVKEKSMHVSGKSVDMKRSARLLRATKNLQARSGGGVGIGPTVIHVDTRKRIANWFYR